MTQDIAAVLSRTPAIVRGLFEGASPAAIEFHEKPEAWSPRQVLCHIADGEITDWIPRLELILSSADDVVIVKNTTAACRRSAIHAVRSRRRLRPVRGMADRRVAERIRTAAHGEPRTAQQLRHH